MCTNFLLESLKQTEHSDDVGVEGRIILKCILWKMVGGGDWICRIGTSVELS
jgi:hypothetical protein